MIPVVNKGTGKKIAELWAALQANEDIAVRSLPAFDHGQAKMPDRINVRFGERSFVFDYPMANAVADQLNEAGFPVFADRLRPEPSV